MPSHLKVVELKCGIEGGWEWEWEWEREWVGCGCNRMISLLGWVNFGSEDSWESGIKNHSSCKQCFSSIAASKMRFLVFVTHCICVCA
jgi:hypothetical protein